MISYVLTNEELTISLENGECHSLNPTHINFNKVLECLIQKNDDELFKCLDVKTAFRNWGKKKIIIEGDQFIYKGKVLHTALSRRAVELFKEGKNIKPIELFLDKLKRNPDSNISEQLYRFLTTNNLPLTWDGDFLAYKIVKTDYSDCYTGTIDNSIGKFVKIPRDECCKDPTILCAPGLHACSKNYFGQYGGDGTKLIIVKISPENVVSIPNEYQDTKLRCCAYYCLEDCPEGVQVDYIYERTTVWEHNQKPEFIKQKIHNVETIANDLAKAERSTRQKRDKFGRFVKV